MSYIDLHCHLDGSITIETLRALAQNAGIVLPNNHKELLSLVEAPAKCQSLIEYLTKFDLPVSCLQIKENLFKASKDLIVQASKDRVVYIEIRFAPLLHVQKGLSVEDILDSVIEGTKAGVSQVKGTGHFIEVGVIVCGMRHELPENNVQMVKKAAAFYGKGLCGVDIAGDEVNYPPEVQKPMFDLAKDLNIPITIHAGECGNASNVIKAIKLGAKRIGHGIALANNMEALNKCKEAGVTLEMCPTSNLQTKAVKKTKDYPFRLFMDAGLKVTVNTDNRIVSQTTMEKEMTWLSKNCGMTVEEQRQIYLNSVYGAFTSQEIKDHLLQLEEK